MAKKTALLRVVLMTAAVSFLSGCTNWEKKYKALEVEHQNLKGLYENCVASLDSSSAKQAELSQQLSQSQTTIEELQKQISQKKATPASATGFQVGEVSVDEKAGTITVTLENTILFAPGSAKLKGATSAELDHIYNVIRERYSGRQIDVVGHTDSDPIRKTKNLWQDNWDLSAGRALTVLRYLVNKGIPPQQIRGVACGESRPVASNATAAGKAKNRRVEIVVHMR
ncbi:MAG TPA: OmpA family protein [Anaerohalosphaeraceae bacterium]|nr:OmpA family protein [Anaerohalosphaeraceae bacterium]HOL89443.1 OmpA family protein [Anaerohalosphaeraceae bacterium]HOQ04300.1 OmpA family protein [Anaerohalosphaeraceae bacterium]HPP56727.1 OmpA family protein [Anaerohalosphaeraceae bacterium]